MIECITILLTFAVVVSAELIQQEIQDRNRRQRP